MNRIVSLASASLLCLVLAGCPMNSTQRQQAASAAQQVSIVANGFEQAEIAAHNQKLIPDDDHLFIQQQMLTLATVGKATDSCILTTSTTPGVVNCLNTAVAAVDKINAAGGLYLKSEKAKTDFTIAMIGVKTVLTSITALLGGK